GEVMAEHHPLVGGHVVEPVIAQYRGWRARRVQPQHRVLDELAVEAKADREHRDGRGHQPDRVDRFAAPERHHAEAGCTDDGDGGPYQLAGDTGSAHGDLHGGSPRQCRKNRPAGGGGQSRKPRAGISHWSNGRRARLRCGRHGGATLAALSIARSSSCASWHIAVSWPYSSSPRAPPQPTPASSRTC